MKKIKLFSALGILIFFYALQFEKPNHSVLDIDPVQTIAIHELNTPTKVGITTKLFFPKKPTSQQNIATK